MLLPVVGGRLSDLDGKTDVGDGLAQGDHLCSGFELADDLYSFGEAFGYGYVVGSSYSGDTGPVWPD